MEFPIKVKNNLPRAIIYFIFSCWFLGPAFQAGWILAGLGIGLFIVATVNVGIKTFIYFD